MRALYGFLVGMWALMLAGGGIAVAVLGPVSITGYGDLDPALSSAVKGATAVLLAVLWIVILSKMKNWMFRRTLS